MWITQFDINMRNDRGTRSLIAAPYLLPAKLELDALAGEILTEAAAAASYAELSDGEGNVNKRSSASLRACAPPLFCIQEALRGALYATSGLIYNPRAAQEWLSWRRRVDVN
jgi:hypothetical protein